MNRRYVLIDEAGMASRSLLIERKIPPEEPKRRDSVVTQEVSSPVSELAAREPELKPSVAQEEEAEEVDDRTFIPAQLPHFARTTSDDESKPPAAPS